MGRIIRSAQAGTPDKNADCLVSIYPAEENSIEISSIVMTQYGQAIRASVEEELKRFDVTGARVVVADTGAIDCVLKARIETAILRSMEQ